MTFKTIIVHAEGGTASDRRVKLAVDLAQRFDASLIGLGAEACDEVALAAAGDAMMLEALRERSVLELSAAQARFCELTQGLSATSWIQCDGYPDKMLSLHARGADLIVASRPARGDSAAYTAKVADLVMGAGAPVLVCADGPQPLRADKIVVAWKDGRESHRAVSDALPLLKRAREVVVVGVSGEANQTAGQSDALTAVALRLRRHDVAAIVETAPKGRGAVTEAIEDAASRHGADLIVTGAYGHSRLEEWWLGGVTEDLVTSCSKYVFLSR